MIRFQADVTINTSLYTKCVHCIAMLYVVLSRSVVILSHTNKITASSLQTVMQRRLDQAVQDRVGVGGEHLSEINSYSTAQYFPIWSA